jgi:hypothetical protein
MQVSYEEDLANHFGLQRRGGSGNRSVLSVHEIPDEHSAFKRYVIGRKPIFFTGSDCEYENLLLLNSKNGAISPVSACHEWHDIQLPKTKLRTRVFVI